jgi:23S rRNA (cytosine1962-C5)-methyltransferase
MPFPWLAAGWFDAAGAPGSVGWVHPVRAANATATRSRTSRWRIFMALLTFGLARRFSSTSVSAMMNRVGTDRAHELLDAGEGRRLERFGARIVDRPAPAATGLRRHPIAWDEADLRFERERGWEARGAPIEPWPVETEGLTLELRPTEAGQVGWFPEHAALWPWLRGAIADRPGAEVLHLFGYTGATSLVLARAGARVTHVDGSRPTVAWARRNAELSRLADAPIRWIVDDAETFLRREARRGRRYEGILLDPPSYGHGPAGRRWELESGIDDLLEASLAVAEGRAFILLTAHTPGWDGARLSQALERSSDRRMGRLDSGELRLDAPSGAVLSLGSFARVELAG